MKPNEAVASRELDALIAVKFGGWSPEDAARKARWEDGTRHLPRYSCDHNDAAELITRLQSGFGVKLDAIWGGGWFAEVCEAAREGGIRYGQGRGSTMPLALCRALLEADASREG